MVDTAPATDQRPERRRRRADRVVVASAVALVIGASAIAVSPAAGAGAQASVRTYIGRASAEGVRSTYTVPGFLIVETFADVAGPIAQSAGDNNGSALAFASLPYPGDTVVNAGSLYAVGTGQAPPASYPLFVQAEHPATPEASQADPSGTYQLDATASETGSAAEAAVGPDEGGTSARSSTSVVIDDDGTMTVTAESVFRGLAFGDGTLRVSSLTSRSVTTYAPGGEPATEATTVIDGATVSGAAVEIGGDGITAAGSRTPVPVAELTAALDEQLAEAGIAVRTVEPTTLEGGAASAALEVISTQTVPIPGGPTGTLVQRVGGVSTEVVLGAALAGQPLAPSTPGGPAGPAPSTSGSVPSPVIPATGATAPAPQIAPAVAASPPTAPPAVEPVFLARDLRAAVRFFYLILVVGGATGLAGSVVWRVRGLRATWLS